MRLLPVDTPLLAEGANPLRPNRRRIEDAEIHAPVDHADPPGRLRVPLAHELGRVLRIADDGVAARHHTVVPSLQAAALVIDAVIGGHEAAAGAPCGKKCAPGGGAAPGVNQAYAGASDEPDEPRRVEKYRQRVLRLGREADQLATGAGKLVLKPPARRHHERPAAGQRHCLRHFDRGTLRAARRQLGYDLENDGPWHSF